MNECLWYEVWTDDGLSPPYLLLLLCAKDGSGYKVFDPVEKRSPFQSAHYEEARLWLLEDEFTQVRGRMLVDDELATD